MPIAIPTSAFLRAGASFMPSPVTATTLPNSLSNLTTRIFTVGVLRAITQISGSFSLSCASVISSISLASRAILPAVISPSSSAMATAVMILSPVRIFTPTPALWQDLTASETSARSGSEIATKPSKTIPLSICLCCASSE